MTRHAKARAVFEALTSQTMFCYSSVCSPLTGEIASQQFRLVRRGVREGESVVTFACTVCHQEQTYYASGVVIVGQFLGAT